MSHCCRPQTKIPPPPLLHQQNIPPAICYVRSQGPGLAHPHTRSYLYFATTPGQRREDTDTGDYCFLELVVSVCNIQIIIPTWLMMTNNNPTNNQPVLTLIVLSCVLYDIVEVDNDNYSCCNYTLFEIGLHNNSPSEALTHSNLVLTRIIRYLCVCSSQNLVHY